MLTDEVLVLGRQQKALRQRQKEEVGRLIAAGITPQELNKSFGITSAQLTGWIGIGEVEDGGAYDEQPW